MNDKNSNNMYFTWSKLGM